MTGLLIVSLADFMKTFLTSGKAVEGLKGSTGKQGQLAAEYLAFTDSNCLFIHDIHQV